MANKLISQMRLPHHLVNIFAARNILTAKDALSLTEFELMVLLDVSLEDVRSAVARISEAVSPPYQTVMSLMEHRVRGESFGGRLPTQLRGLDEALLGGVPFGCLTELVGPAGIGKTQFCLKLALLAAIPPSSGGLDGRVLYIDTESKFSPRRMIEIGENSFPHIFLSEGMAKEMAGRIVVMRPATLSDFTDSLQQIKLSVLQYNIRLLIIDSMAALMSGENENSRKFSTRYSLACPVSFLKSLAELSRIPIVATNQVRSQSSDETCHYKFEGLEKNISHSADKLGSHLVAALGIQWAHAVTIRLVFEAHSDQRFIKIAKSPASPPLSFPFTVNASGISLLSDEGILVMGPAINAIRSKGQTLL